MELQLKLLQIIFILFFRSLLNLIPTKYYLIKTFKYYYIFMELQLFN